MVGLEQKKITEGRRGRAKVKYHGISDILQQK